MIDELELAFDEPGERGRHRRRRRGRKKGSGGAGKSLIAFLVVLVLLGALAGGVWWGFGRIQGFFEAPDYAGGGTGSVTIEVKEGETLTAIANTLVSAGVVKSVKAFTDAAGKNPKSSTIQPGFYKLRKQMRASDAVAMLIDLKNKVVNRVTIPEGKSAKQTYQILAKATGIPAAQFATAAKNPGALGVSASWFQRGDGKKVTPSIEGFLFPATYELRPKPTAQQILADMVKQFVTVTNQIDFAGRAQALQITPYEALIVASLAQAEAGNAKDLGKVARVAYNRVYNDRLDFPCRCLEMDVTVNYWLELNNKPTKASKNMTAAELDDPRNPYNRKIRGLIPSPINNPGKAALEGAMAPPKGNWLYFVAIDKQGNSAFAETFAQHQQNEQKACAAKIIC